MEYGKYESLYESLSGNEFRFKSEGPKGAIEIVVQFIETTTKGVVSLVFGNLLPGGKIDHYVRNNNQDRNKVLATVAAVVYEFTAGNPDKRVFFTGSTAARTRLYRMAIALNLAMLQNHFELFGVYTSGDRHRLEKFQKNMPYTGFVIKRKNI